MKNKLFFAFILFLTWSNKISAHKEWVHQYLVKEAYYFLEQQIACEPTDLKNHMGLNVFGIGDELSPWTNNEGVALGAWLEDVTDPVWGHDLFDGWTPSITHFWSADYGDDKLHPIPFSSNTAPNAWQKAKIYLFGGHYLFIKKTEVDEINGHFVTLQAKFYTYTSLVDFYKTGKCNLVGYWPLNDDNPTFINPKEKTLTTELSHKIAYQILGRIAHLLGDMSVPAHCHSDNHPCNLGDGDKYELWMGGYSNKSAFTCEDSPSSTFSYPAQSWDRYTAATQGGLITEILSMSDQDAMRYLFYTTNQLADHFPSINEDGDIDGDGDNGLQNGTNQYLLDRYQILGDPSTTINENDIANETFNYAIRATATLFYWFALRTNLLNASVEKNVYCYSTVGYLSPVFKNPDGGNASHNYNNPLEISGLANANTLILSITKIVSSTGYTIRTINISNPQATVWWDGKNDQGMEAPSGLYHAVVAVSNLSFSNSITQFFVKENPPEIPTILPVLNPYQSIKKPPLTCCALDVVYTNETFITDQTLTENVFQARNTLILDNVIIPSGSNIVFKAKDEIVLKPGTIIEAGSNATFTLEECASSFLPACSNHYNFLYRKARSTGNEDTTGASQSSDTEIIQPDEQNLNTLKSKLFSESHWTKLSIYNSMGQKLYEIKDPGEKFMMENLKSGNEKINLPQGLYFFYFSNEQEGAVRKVVKL